MEVGMMLWLSKTIKGVKFPLTENEFQLVVEECHDDDEEFEE